MIMVKRVTQPPRLSWLLWDTAMPDLQIAAHLEPEKYNAVAKDTDKLSETVREALRLGELRLMEFHRQLLEL